MAFEPSKPVARQFYRCDRRFHVDVLMEMQQKSNVFGLAWCTGDDVNFYSVDEQRSVAALGSCTAHLKNKHGRGGQSQKRFERLIDAQRNDYFHHVAERAAELLGSYTHVFLVGNRIRTTEIGKRFSVAPTIVISDQATSIQDIVKTLDLSVDPVLDSVLHEFYDVAMHRELVVYGPTETLAALDRGQLKTLICADPAMEDRAVALGTQFVLLTDRTEVSHRFCREFGHVGGILRYKLTELEATMDDGASV